MFVAIRHNGHEKNLDPVSKKNKKQGYKTQSNKNTVEK